MRSRPTCSTCSKRPSTSVCDEFAEDQLEWDPRPAVCVVLASGGYPGNYAKGKVIKGLDEAAKMPDVKVFHAGTRLDGGMVAHRRRPRLGRDGPGRHAGRGQTAGPTRRWNAIHFQGCILRRGHRRQSTNLKAVGTFRVQFGLRHTECAYYFIYQPFKTICVNMRVC